jgi:hypothetical protein
LIDPTCGSGHFLLGAFQRFVDEWQRAEPSRNRRDIAQKALDAVAGVDLNPFAVAISRFRLLVAALLASDVHKLSEAPDFRIHVAIGDSLLHGKRFGMTTTEGMFESAEHYAGTGLAHAYVSEDLAEVQRILGRQYHAVVGNPPYIVVRDAALNSAYRARYASCHRQYSLGCPFTERFFELALTGQEHSSAGFVGLITTNSFMKREFGSKLIEEVLPRLDLTHILDTSVASIPGHGTPTVILLGRHQTPVSDVVRTVMGIKGEPSPPEDSSTGLVWRAIVDQVDHAGSESDFVTVADTHRALFSRHPWSVVGGGAADLRELIESGRETLKATGADLGYHVITGEDNCLMIPASSVQRLRLTHVRPIIEGDCIRDWSCEGSDVVLWPYTFDGRNLVEEEVKNHVSFLWPYRRSLKERKAFGVPVEQRGLRWWDIREIYKSRLETKLTISVAFVATNNHFFLERGERVFKQSAPVIKLPGAATETEYLNLLSLLNSSTACFWFQQVCHNKGGPGGGSSKDEKWHDFYEFASTPLAEFPVATGGPIQYARRLDAAATSLAEVHPARQFVTDSDGHLRLPTRATLDAARKSAELLRRGMISLQEELDWSCYSIYGVLPSNVNSADVCADDPPEVALGERAFEIVLARRSAAGDIETRWFEWLGVKPITEVPTRWSDSYRAVVNRRIGLIEQDRNIGLLEAMACKRRWESPAWAELEKNTLREWLLARLESKALWPASGGQPAQITTTSRLADTLQRDPSFIQIAQLYAGHADFEIAQLVADLVGDQAVPFLPILRYTETGLRKRAQWDDTWTLQRREDSGENVGNIPVPPKYQSKDFLKLDVWRMRGALDVPNERWVSYPGCERGADGSLPIAWAGWDHLQQATALAAYYLEMKEGEGWEAARLQPLLAGLLELVPWLEQWHNEVDPVYGERMGAYYKGFVSEEARAHGFTLDDLRAWKPAAGPVRRGRRARSAV